MRVNIRRLLSILVLYASFFFLNLAPECEIAEGGRGDQFPVFSGRVVGLNNTALPSYFIPNMGQVDKQVRFYTQGQNWLAYFTAKGVVVALFLEAPHEKPNKKEEHPGRLQRSIFMLRIDFIGVNPGVQPRALNETGATISYFKGRPDAWRTGMPTYSKIIYPHLWQGIDLVYSADWGGLKHEFNIHAKADPSAIRLAYKGATEIRLNERGQMEIKTPLGSLINDLPVAYQEINGRKIEVSVRYVLKATPEGNVCSFGLDDYDSSFPLVIDPIGFVFCNVFGGPNDDLSYGICVDKSKNLYVAGMTYSIDTYFSDFPGLKTDSTAHADAFVAKINASGAGLVYIAYLGGDDSDVCYGLAIDSDENAYLTGYTYSRENTFPCKAGPGLTLKGLCDAFVVKIDASGTRLIYSGYIGGSDYDFGYGIATDAYGNAYITGETFSSEGTFPVTVGPDLTHNQKSDAYVAKVNASGTQLVYCGYIGGSSDDRGNSIVIDKEGNAYIAGDTKSLEDTFPVRRGPDLTFNNRGRNARDAFVAKVNRSGSALVFCGYIGGAGDDSGKAIAVDSAGSVYVAGETSSDEDSFPVQTGPDPIFNGDSDAFVAKVHSLGSIFLYCGYIGGSGWDSATGVAVSEAGEAYVTGYTSSSEHTFPVTVGPDLTYNGNFDAFVAKVNFMGLDLDYCGYLGSANDDVASSIAVDEYGVAYITGWTRGDRDVTPTQGALLADENAASFDIFIAKIFSAKVLPIFDGNNYSGKKAVDIAVWRPSDGNWYIKDHARVNFGLPGDIPVPGDYDGDGKTDIAVYRPSSSLWLIRNRSQVTHGKRGDIPVPGDYDGDGKTDIAVFRPAAGMWLVKDKFSQFLGGSEDIPVPADYDGDGKTDLAVFNPLTGHWRIKDQFHAFFGAMGDIPVPRDYDGDGKADLAIFRPREGLWMIKDQFRVNFGAEGDIPVPGDYDGNGTADIAIFRPSVGLWKIKDQFEVYFGKTGDIPLVR